MSDEEAPPEKRTGRVINLHAREHVVPPPGINNFTADSRPNIPPKDGQPGHGKRWTELIARVEVRKEVTWQEVAAEMDDEELSRRQFRDKNGTFGGRPPGRLPGGFVKACDAEIVARGAIQWKDAYQMAIGTLVQIALSGKKDSDRIRAAMAVIERIEGKVADRVVISAAAGGGESVDDILAGVIATVNAEAAENAAVARAHDYSARTEGLEDE